MNATPVIGLFVGGRGTRMGGVVKGLLRVPDGEQTIVERLLALCTRMAPNAAVYLVGDAKPYARFSIPSLSDDPSNIGPIGGLRSLLRHAEAASSPLALALAGDLPFLNEPVMTRLLAPLRHAARVPLVAGRLQPLAASYRPAPTLAAVDDSLKLGRHALMHVLERLGGDIEQLSFDAAEARALVDWDTPDDVHR